ncbi:hypothetical protein [Alteromonas gracilis]|uniref:hypothetical protein n=1 Tax=Alteromonas gracilis TaxID=1479524 RepID=UPI003735C48E
MKFTVYIPRKNSRLADIVSPASAIVKSRTISDTSVMVYYEGNVYGAENIKTFEDKCSLAAGRAKDHYPTTALTIVPLEEVIDIGVYDLETNAFHLDENFHELFNEWVTYNQRQEVA